MYYRNVYYVHTALHTEVAYGFHMCVGCEHTSLTFRAASESMPLIRICDKWIIAVIYSLATFIFTKEIWICVKWACVGVRWFSHRSMSYDRFLNK